MPSSLRTLLFLCVLAFAHAANAATADAREVARLNNCSPKKIEVVQQSLGPEGSTLYHVDCNMPKTKDATATGADAVLIQCDANLCEFIRPVASEKK